MDKNAFRITVLGAGISGLTTAYWLDKEGYAVRILEFNDEPGGSMETIAEDKFLIDFGPNSGLETTPLISQLAEEVGLKDEMIYASEESDKRYILKHGELHALPTSPPAFVKTKLFSTTAKLRVMGEPFVGKSEDGYYQSIADFVTRRLGKEFLDYAIDPFVSGVFAGDPHKLSVKSAFPKLYRLEELYGGLVKGMIKGARERKKRAEKSKQNARMFSFSNGMQTFPKAIADKLENKVIYNSKVLEIRSLADAYEIIYFQDGQQKFIHSDVVLSTIPAHRAKNIFEKYDPTLYEHFESIYYPAVIVLYVGFNRKDIGRPLDGFGYLIPSKEKKTYLGAIWSSTIFPNRSDDETAAFTIFIGGAKAPRGFADDKEELIKDVINQFKETMKIFADPVTVKHRMWDKAIPQYNLGYIEHERYFEEFEKNNPGLFLSGNYRGGISVGDCVKNSELVADKIKTYINNKIYK